jgi:hypothetical protein
LIQKQLNQISTISELVPELPAYKPLSFTQKLQSKFLMQLAPVYNTAVTPLGGMQSRAITPRRAMPPTPARFVNLPEKIQTSLA